jgi:hypothetical protein
MVLSLSTPQRDVCWQRRQFDTRGHHRWRFYLGVMLLDFQTPLYPAGQLTTGYLQKTRHSINIPPLGASEHLD